MQLPRMKLFSSICFALAILCQLSFYADQYELGYYGRSYVPGELLALLLWPILIFALIGAWLVALRHQTNRWWTTCALLGAVAPFFCLPPPAYLNAYGLRDCVMKDYRPEDLRQLAKEIHLGLGFSNGQEIFFDEAEGMTDTQRRLYAQWVAQYHFLHRNTSPRDPVISNPGAGVVDFMWGGGFGHWGFCVATNGQKLTPEPVPHTKILHVSDDIYFYAGE